jgi:hypothetical protein
MFGEAKEWHGMRRFRLRTLWRVNAEALLIATAQNIKRVLTFSGRGPRKLAQAQALRHRPLQRIADSSRAAIVGDPHRSSHVFQRAGAFYELRHNGVLRSSHIRPSAKSINFNACNYLIIPDKIGSPSGVARLSGWGYRGVLRPYIVGLLVCLPAKSPRESPPLPLWAITHEEEDHDEP